MHRVWQNIVFRYSCPALVAIHAVFHQLTRTILCVRDKDVRPEPGRHDTAHYNKI